MHKFFITFLAILTTQLYGDFKGKVDLGSAFIHLDTIVGNKTVSKSDLGAIKFDASLYTESGLGVRTSVLQSVWDIDNVGEDVTSVQLALGQCFPITSSLTLFPQVGVSWSSISTDILIPIIQNEMVVAALPAERTSKSAGYFIGCEACYKVTQCLRFCGQILWGWTDIDSTFEDKKSKKQLDMIKSCGNGPILSSIIEYDLNDSWSVNVGGAYNLSWDDDNNGLRAWGGKVGIAYWF